MLKWLGTGALATFFAACTLTTSLDGLSGGPDAAPEGGTESGAPSEAGPEASPDQASPSAYAGAVLADKPLSYWRLGEASGTKAVDEVHTADGTYSGGITLGAKGAINGDPDTAASFDGSSTFVDVGDRFEFPDRAPFSIEAWVKPAQTNDAKAHRIVSRRNNDSNGYRLMIDTNGTLLFERWVADVPTGVSGPVLAPKRYTHVVATYDGTTQTIYVDGVLAGSKADATSFPAITFPFAIGSTSNHDGEWFEGSIDEVAIYDKTLTAARVAAHFTASTP